MARRGRPPGDAQRREDELLALLSKLQRPNCWASDKWLAEQLDCSPRTVRRHLLSLEKKGFIRRQRQPYIRQMLWKTERLIQVLVENGKKVFRWAVPYFREKAQRMAETVNDAMKRARIDPFKLLRELEAKEKREREAVRSDPVLRARAEKQVQRLEYANAKRGYGRDVEHSPIVVNLLKKAPGEF